MKIYKIKFISLTIFVIVSIQTCTENKKLSNDIKTNQNESISKIKIDTLEWNKIVKSHKWKILNYDDFNDQNLKVKYHKWQPTASRPKLIKWNIELTTNTKNILKETIDSNGRVVELMFLQNNKIFDGFTAFEAPIIRYKYKDNKIFETLYDEDLNPFYGLEAGVPTLTVYFLNKNNIIDSCETEFYLPDFEFAYNDSITVMNSIREMKNNKSCDLIYLYFYSSAKYKGKMPKRKGFDSTNVFKPY
jgi:hypothetical protein